MADSSYFRLECVCGAVYTATVDQRTCVCPNCKRAGEIEWFRPLTVRQPELNANASKPGVLYASTPRTV